MWSRSTGSKLRIGRSDGYERASETCGGVMPKPAAGRRPKSPSPGVLQPRNHVRGRSVHEAVRDRVAHDLGGGAKVELLEDAGAIGAHRLHAEVERGCDIRYPVAGGQQTQHLELAVRKAVVGQLPFRPAEVGDQGLPDRGGDVAPSANDAPDGGE